MASVAMASKTPAAIQSSRRLTGCRVRDHPPRQMFGVLPAAPCDQAHEHHRKAVPIGLTPSVTTQRMVVETGRDERLDASPEGIYNFGVNARIIGGPPLGRWWLGKHPESLGASTTTGGCLSQIRSLDGHPTAYPRGL